MAVSGTTCVVEYTLDGVETEYSVPYVFFDEEDLVVTWGVVGTETTLVLGAGYTVATRPTSLPATGTITLTSPGTATQILRIRRQTRRIQTVSLTQTGPYNAKAFERAFDRGTLIDQEQDQAQEDNVAVAGEFVHGNLGGGSLHAVATSSSNGFMSSTDKAKLDLYDSTPSTAYVYQAGTITEGGSAVDLFTRTPSGGTSQFSVTYTGATSEGVFDNVKWDGWNTSAAGDDPAEPIIRYALEANFKIGGVEIAEHYFEFYNIARDVHVRPLFVNHTRVAGVTSVQLRGDNGNAGGTGFVDVGVGSTQIMKWLTGAVQIVQAYPISWVASGAKTFLSAANVAGTSTRTLMQMYADDNIGFGGTGVIRYDPNAAKLAFFANNPISKQTIVGPTSLQKALSDYGLLTLGTMVATPTWGANVSIDASLGNYFFIPATSNTPYTIGAPTGGATGQRITIRVRNGSGGVLGTATWNGAFLMAAWTNPADGYSRSVDFVYDGTNWVEVSRTPADVPN